MWLSVRFNAKFEYSQFLNLQLAYGLKIVRRGVAEFWFRRGLGILDKWNIWHGENPKYKNILYTADNIIIVKVKIKTHDTGLLTRQHNGSMRGTIRVRQMRNKIYDILYLQNLSIIFTLECYSCTIVIEIMH